MKSKSRHFPEYERLQSPRGITEIFGGSINHLANQRNKGIGFPYLKQGTKVIYDVDACYEHALKSGSGRNEAA